MYLAWGLVHITQLYYIVVKTCPVFRPFVTDATSVLLNTSRGICGLSVTESLN